MVSETTTRKAQTVANHEKSMMEETNKVIATEAEEAQRIRNSYVTVSFDNRRLFDLEVVKEGEKSTDAVKRGVQRLEDLRVENRLTQIKLNEDLTAVNKQKLQELEKTGQNDVEQRKSHHLEMERKIQENKANTQKELDREIKINETVQQGKTKIAIEMEAQKYKKLKEHEEKLLKLNQENADIKLKHQDELMKLAKSLRIENKKQSKEIHSLKHSMMIGNSKMLDAAHKDKKHDEFRRQCRLIVNMFNDSKKHLDGEELAVMRAMSEMRTEQKMSCSPKLKNVTSSLQNFTNEIQKLAAPSDSYDGLQIRVQDTVAALDTEIKTMDTEIFAYKTQKTGSAEVVEKALKSARTFMLELGKLVLLFNIRPSSHIGETLALEMSKLAQRAGLAQIQNGESSSTLPQDSDTVIEEPDDEEEEESEEEKDQEAPVNTKVTDEDFEQLN